MRLILTLGLACALLTGVGLMGARSQHQSNLALGDLYANKLVPATSLARLLEALGSERAAVTRAASAAHGDLLARAGSEITQDRKREQQAWTQVKAAQLAPAERQLAQRFLHDSRSFQNDADTALQDMRGHHFPDAEKLLDGSGERDYGALRHDVLGLFDLETTGAARSFHADEHRAHLAAMVSDGAIGTGLAASMLFSFLLIRSLTRSLDTAVTVADRIADGQLNHTIDIQRDDELGRLLRALRRMDQRLTGICMQVRNGATEVSVAAGQIAQGTDDLSRRTQEQASSLEETAASMEEMTSTVRHNADNARLADQLARGACEQAEHGGAVAREAVTAMQSLAQSSTRIADIVGLIDEIAFQTNLLSLNAAVEAARAGEHGRGFAIVAGEVRNLAQRSASAAREIKSLVNDAVARSEAGQVLVDRSGKALAGIVDSVKKVTDVVAEIAAASAEQSTGIDQVNTAVMTMDEVTQQNSALVEEAAAATRAMQEQAQMLQRQVAYFRFDGSRGGQVEAVAMAPSADDVAETSVLPVQRDGGRAVSEMVEGALTGA